MCYEIIMRYYFSHIFQRDHVHGGGQRCHHHPHPQLPPQEDGDSRDASVGECGLELSMGLRRARIVKASTL